MSEATYLVDGVDLSDPAGRWKIEADTKLPAVANRRIATLELPFSDGAVRIPQGLGTGSVGLSIAVLASETTIDAYLSAIKALLVGAREITWAPAGGLARTAGVIEAVVAEPKSEGEEAAIIPAALTVDPFWRETAVITTPEVTVAAGAQTVTFPALAGCTGRLLDAVVRVKGPFSSLTGTSPVDGTGLIWGTAVAAGTYLYIDTRSWKSWTSTSASAWTPTGTIAVPDFPAAGPLTIWPVLAGDPLNMPVRLTVTAAGVSAATAIALRARRWFL